ncbi:hemagglutinin repeat-containing protein [Pseudomonas sp. JV241A]|uniref:hemagglutinin repeat-containing protein n=1 Tax=Pseudomonas sp. JV241A TaxID=2078785 RepID=UPI00100CEB29|nr:hemagglutinin repeat-containing protein [Pseudomonas sp. JV241A]SPO68379.1 Filamentous hemagglutinin outer membrane protein [Pseudomonas sp. JV241A]
MPKTPSPAVQRRRLNRLRWMIALSLMTPGVSLADNGLQAATGIAGTPLITDQHGVPVIDIVAPNASGLSHNQFLDYNVNKPGLVLNNALQAGQSQLAGALAANPQFQGQAASTILSEVISRNASRIEGPQEIFGRPADYILANPNGITLNGGGFINTTRAGFLVGTAELEDQRIKYLDTRAANGTLEILDAGQSNRAGALELIAPRIESRGTLEARDELSLVVGRNRIDVADGQVIEHLAAPAGSIDARLFGAMQAGRIRILSTALGAGVRMGSSQLQARDGIDMDSAGTLEISASAEQPGRLYSENGAVNLKAADDLSLDAVRVQAPQVNIKAGKNLTLDARTRETISRERQSREEKWWFVTTETYDRESTRTQRQQVGSQILASQDINLQAGDDLRMVAATVEAGGDLSVNVGKDLTISAGTDSLQVDEQIRHRKHLWRGDKDSSSYQESARASALSGLQVSLTSKGSTQILGSTLNSAGDMSLKAGNLEVAAVTLKSDENTRNYSGDLVSGTFFGKNGQTEAKGQQGSGSTLQAQGALTVAADQVQIKGSRVQAKGDALLLSEKARLSVEATQNQSSVDQRETDSKLFGLITETSQRQEQRQQVLSSDVASESNLRLASADDLQVIGSRLEAGKQLHLQAQNNISVSTAEQLQSVSEQNQQQGFTASASQTQDAADGKPDSRQYTASVGYGTVRTDTTKTDLEQVASTLKGAGVQLNSGNDINLNGSYIEAVEGDLQLDGRAVTLTVAHEQQSQQTTSTESGGGLRVSGGIDAVGSAFEGYHKRQVLDERASQAQRSSLVAAGDVQLKAVKLVNEAARLTAGRSLELQASTVDNRAVDDTQESELTQTNWQASLGASLVYKDLTRPVENLVTGTEASRFQQASIEDALAPPTLGADLEFKHLNRKELKRSSTAQVTELTAQHITLKADTLNDTGTQYRATQGPLAIQAQSHRFAAAQDSTGKRVERLDVDAAVRVETSTGSDINLRLSGKGGSLLTDNSSQTARPGSLYGQTGIQIQVGSDGLYEGTRFNAGDGSLEISAKGNLSLVQANDQQRQQENKLEGNAWFKAGNAPAGSALELRGYLDQSKLDSIDTQARVVEIDAKGKVQLQAGGALELVGGRIGSSAAKVSDIELQSAGALKVSTGVDTHEAQGSNLGGGLELLGKSTSNGKGGGLGGHFSTGRVDESSSTASGANWFAKEQLLLSSAAGQDDALQLQGVKASANQIAVTAREGGVLIEAATSSDRRNNLDITAGAGINAAPGASSQQAKRGLYARGQVNIDRRDNLTFDNSQWRAGQISLTSLTDTRLEGVGLDAGRIDGQVGGDLRITSRQDQVDSLKVAVDARLSQERNPQGYINAANAVAGPLAGKVEKQVGSALQKVDPKTSPTFTLKVEHTQRNTVASQSALNAREGIALEVGGRVLLSGASLQANRGKVQLGGAPVTQQALQGRDYYREVGVNASNAPVDLVSGLINVYGSGGNANGGEQPVDLGLLRTSGHDRSSILASSIKEGGKPR